MNKERSKHLTQREQKELEDELYQNPEDEKKDGKENKENYNDMFDVVQAVMSVKSPHDVLNEDFIVADLNSDLFQNQAILYIKEHLNIIVALNNFLTIHGDKRFRIKCYKLLLDDVTVLTNLSRASMGKVLLAILRYIEGQGQVAQQLEQPAPTKNVIGRTFDKITGQGGPPAQ